MPGIVLQADNITRSFSELIVLNGINFSLSKGTSACIVAPSGKGKSTLLSICGLLMRPTSGHIYINEKDVTDLPDTEVSKLRGNNIGFMFQHTQLAGNFRANENISLQSSFASDRNKFTSKTDIERREDELLEHFGLLEKKYYYPSQLSIGQKRRIACARALFMKPELIIADEPTNDLDDANKQIVVDALFEPVRQGTSSLLFATHDLELAKTADLIIEL